MDRIGNACYICAKSISRRGERRIDTNATSASADPLRTESLQNPGGTRWRLNVRTRDICLWRIDNGALHRSIKCGLGALAVKEGHSSTKPWTKLSQSRSLQHRSYAWLFAAYRVNGEVSDKRPIIPSSPSGALGLPGLRHP